ncbi:MAG: chloride channel protein, partial [Muribaculaceae bacterium]|nr:chloride channel protein [Muribaculaceae bacterium]
RSSLYYTYVCNNTGHRIDRISNVWLKAILSGLMIGLAIFLFPPLYATGYDTLDKILAGDYQSILGYSLFGNNLSDPMLLVAMAAGIVMVKAFVCSATNYGGGVAGNFAPTLFAGGFLGYVFATLANDCLGATLHVPNFIFLGMSGVMSGVIQAPLMAIFLTAEMADRADFLWPLSVVALVSWGIRRLLGRSLPGV